MGAVMGDLSSRRGKILGMDAGGTFQVVRAEVPQMELYHTPPTCALSPAAGARTPRN
ncbi:MAG: hypothetical protein CM1200mP29_07110 [Verrucomicrobiota bacterium]|nr:MAG: hypothetical protein CM1200mP29_07110 [Verrucomicrobiota bacterium]